jgi:hypothetical protein
MSVKEVTVRTLTAIENTRKKERHEKGRRRVNHGRGSEGEWICTPPQKKTRRRNFAWILGDSNPRRALIHKDYANIDSAG